MTSPNCSTCLKAGAGLTCGVCNIAICKNCAEFVDEEMLAYLPRPSKDLLHSAYCRPCHDEKVKPVQLQFEETLTKARDVSVYFKAQSKETRGYRRKDKAFAVDNCADRDQTVMRLAFLAAQAGFNLIIDVNLSSKKIITNGYQTSVWSGTAIPIKA